MHVVLVVPRRLARLHACALQPLDQRLAASHLMLPLVVLALYNLCIQIHLAIPQGQPARPQREALRGRLSEAAARAYRLAGGSIQHHLLLLALELHGVVIEDALFGLVPVILELFHVVFAEHVRGDLDGLLNRGVDVHLVFVFQEFLHVQVGQRLLRLVNARQVDVPQILGVLRDVDFVPVKHLRAGLGVGVHRLAARAESPRIIFELPQRAG
mmetsp:Transcript_30729/g.53917  ORF Transcript_30729/g.53917 Transcript_30729/m.53917 type:complete len:213 (+) Transcript_30729:726-1364(+)